MQMLFASFGRALLAQLHVRMLLLTILPFVASVALWAIGLWLCLQPMIDFLPDYFIRHGTLGT
ncbi:hypothetical protein PMI40_04407, partial [Herbaspirillum sp. YR522]